MLKTTLFVAVAFVLGLMLGATSHVSAQLGGPRVKEVLMPYGHCYVLNDAAISCVPTNMR